MWGIRAQILPLCILLIFFLLHASPAAALLSIHVSSDRSSIAAQHNEAVLVTFRITHENLLCSITCGYALLDVDTGTTLFSNTQTIASDAHLSIPYTLRAPSKDTGGVGGQKSYIFKASCQDYLCLSSDVDSEEVTLTLNYHLSPQEQVAKDFLDTHLATIKSLLTSLESTIEKLDSRISQLPSNILIDDIESGKNRARSIFTSTRQSQLTASQYYDNLEFLNAQSYYQTVWESQASTASSDVTDLDRQLTARIEYHNQLSRRIQDLSSELNTVSADAKVFDATGDFNQVNDAATALSSRFNEGRFSDYADIESEIDRLQAQIQNLKGSLADRANALKNQLSTSASSEIARLCAARNICNVQLSTSQDLPLKEFLKGFCERDTQTIKAAFDESNEEQYTAYAEKLERVRGQNQQISAWNAQIRELNEVREQLYKLLNKNDLGMTTDDCPPTIAIFSLDTTYVTSMITTCNEMLQTATARVASKEERGFYKFFRFIKNFFTFDRYNYVPSEETPLETEPAEPENIDFTQEFTDTVTTYCSIDLQTAPISSIRTATVRNPQGYSSGTTTIQEMKDHQSKCCVFGTCRTCCEGNECANDAASYPIIFLHGHAFSETESPEASLDAFNRIRDDLLSIGVLLGGTITPSSNPNAVPAGDWGKSGHPVSVKTTYYYGVFSENGQFITAPSKSESIDTYSKRLKDSIDLVKYRTGRNKVIIIAHSMGGLVARNYIKTYGDDTVHKLIMIGTPNHGVYGDVASWCDFSGAAIECQQMAAGSTFLQILNGGDETPGSTQYYTITGTGCVLGEIDGDGIVRSSSVPVQGGQNYYVTGQCSGFWSRDMHTELLDPTIYPATISTVKAILES